MSRRFKRGDKIEIPTTKSVGSDIYSFPLIVEAKRTGVEYMYFSSYRRNITDDTDLCYLSFDGRDSTTGCFLESDLKHYAKNKKGW